MRDGNVMQESEFNDIILAIAEELSACEKMCPGTAEGFLLLLREGLLDTPEDAEDFLSVLEIFQKRYRRE